MFTIVEIRSLTDPLLLPWLDLYETAFPPGERVLVSHILEVLHAPADQPSGRRLLAVVVDEPPSTEPGASSTPSGDPRSLLGESIERSLIGEPIRRSLIGMLFVNEPPGGEVAFLWYFAVDPQARGQGLGAQVYRRWLESLDSTRVRALFFDVEDPAQMQTPEAARLAERRIDFYRRLGARVLGGIRYIQTVGPHQPLLRLHLMVHPLQELTPQQAFDLAYAAFGPDILQQTGDLYWA